MGGDTECMSVCDASIRSLLHKCGIRYAPRTSAGRLCRVQCTKQREAKVDPQGSSAGWSVVIESVHVCFLRAQTNMDVTAKRHGHEAAEDWPAAIGSIQPLCFPS